MSRRSFTVTVKHTESYEKDFTIMAFDRDEAEGLALEAASVFAWSKRVHPSGDNDEVLDTVEGG